MSLFTSLFFVLRPEHDITPIRVVFAANSGVVYLNDCLETGPCLLNNLFDILLRFRVRQYAFCSDIAKAFLCIQVQESDRDYLRFLWFANNDPHGDIISYRYRCLTFGPTCSPYILNTTIKNTFKHIVHLLLRILPLRYMWITLYQSPILSRKLLHTTMKLV